ncbi:MAG: aspartate/glutamate racemase family protein [Treponema sp.]|nr:aspartate/glutamate racemase family protein [Treponema sp.]
MEDLREDRCVLFLDSGLGGIPYFRHFRQRNPGLGVAYLADRLNFPYGRRDRGELAAILAGLVEKIVRTVNPGIIVLACNSASIAALPGLRESFPALAFVGTVPAVKPAALASKTGRIGVLGTELTVRESCIRELAAMHGGCEILGIAAPELVDFVESRLDSADAEERRLAVRRYLDRFRENGVDALVLGCTHFLFLLEDFRSEAFPDIAVFESTQGISRRIESLLAANRPGGGGGVPNRLLLTGGNPPEPSWVTWAERLGCELSLLGEA